MQGASAKRKVTEMATILVEDEMDGEVLIVDTTTDNRVSVTGRHRREEGTPESALALAKRLVLENGEGAKVLSDALKEAALLAIARRGPELVN